MCTENYELVGEKLNRISPIQNIGITRFVQSLNTNLVVDKEMQCPTNSSRVHSKVKRGLFSLCLEKAVWFGIPENSAEDLGVEIRKHGLRTIRRELNFGNLEISGNSNSLSPMNLVTNLAELSTSPWSSTKKSTNKIRKLDFEIMDLDFTDSNLNHMFYESIAWIKARHKLSPLHKLDTDSLLSCAKSVSQNMFLTVLILNGQRAAYIWTIRSKFENTAYFVSTSFNPNFILLSPGTFLFNSIVEKLKEYEYIWFDLGSGHHKYKSSVGNYLYKKSYATLQTPASMSEKLYRYVE